MVDEFDFGFFLQLQKNLLQVQDRTAISGDRQKSDFSNLDTPRFLGRIATYREKQIVIQKKVTMFANANKELRPLDIRSRGLRAPCREAPPRCFSWFL